MMERKKDGITWKSTGGSACSGLKLGQEAPKATHFLLKSRLRWQQFLKSKINFKKKFSKRECLLNLLANYVYMSFHLSNFLCTVKLLLMVALHVSHCIHQVFRGEKSQ